MRSRRAISTKVLPPDLIERIQDHFSGGYLYVPSRMRARRLARNLEIIRMFNAGRSISEIAETFLISRTGVRFILDGAGRKPGGGSDAG